MRISLFIVMPPPIDHMTHSQYRQFIKESQALLKNRQEKLWKEFSLEYCERYDWDQATAQIVFSHSGDPKVVADIQFVGSHSRMTSTWLWSWANPSYDKKVYTDILRLKEFGRLNDISRLMTPKWEADEIDGWEMTSIAANVLEAQGAYRTESDNGFSYLILRNVRWANPVAA